MQLLIAHIVLHCGQPNKRCAIHYNRVVLQCVICGDSMVRQTPRHGDGPDKNGAPYKLYIAFIAMYGGGSRPAIIIHNVYKCVRAQCGVGRLHTAFQSRMSDSQQKTTNHPRCAHLMGSRPTGDGCGRGQTITQNIYIYTERSYMLGPLINE